MSLQMSPNIELLAPGGDAEAIKAAIIAGADAVYCGLNTFNARNRAGNITFEQLVGLIRLAHQYECKIFLTLNIVILEHEFKALTKLLNKLVNTTLDGVIIQDFGLLYVLKKYYPTLDIHASTQMTTHNAGQIPFLKKFGASRVNLSREMNLREITALTKVGVEHDVLMEVFVHGSLCVAFSGLCYSTSASVGNSGNRGRCSQACREEYETTESGNNFPLNIKDNSAFFDLPALIEAGVHSFKVEGRIKGASYVHTVIDSFRKQIDGFLKTGELLEDGERLYKVFNRDFSNAFLRGDLNQSMFIDNPRDNSKVHALEKNGVEKQVAESLVLRKPGIESKDLISVVQIQKVEKDLNKEKSELQDIMLDKIKHLSIDKIPLTLTFSGQLGDVFTVTVTTQEYISSLLTTETKSFEIKSTSSLVKSEKLSLDDSTLSKRFRSLNNEEYNLLELNSDALDDGLSIPYKELTAIRNEISLILNKHTPIHPEVILPPLTKHQKPQTDGLKKADLSILLPDAYKRDCTKYIDFLNQNPRLIPWFPPVLIGKDYDVAVNILKQVKPELIVTNNTGIAYEANALGIKWIAGPFLNTTNSYALLGLQQEFDCAGAFISNEINFKQIRHMARPDNFKMMYSIYHPILLMTSRQCFFQQSVGCEKPRIDNGCMLSCDKSTSITNLKGDSFAIDKQKAGYPSIYNQDQFLNTEIINDLSDMFDTFMIDLTNIGAGDKTSPDKVTLIEQFEQLLSGDIAPIETINTLVPDSTVVQYHNGL